MSFHLFYIPSEAQERDIPGRKCYKKYLDLSQIIFHLDTKRTFHTRQNASLLHLRIPTTDGFVAPQIKVIFCK